MSNERIGQVIVALTRGLTPVRPLPPTTIRAMRVLAVAAIVAVASVWVIGARRDLSAAIRARAFVMSATVAALVAVSATASALRLSVPGLRAWWSAVPMVLLSVWMVALFALWRMAGDELTRGTTEALHLGCVLRVTTISMVPIILIARAVTRGFVLDYGRASGLVVLGGAAVAALAVQFVCPIDYAVHTLVSHVVPVAALMLLGIAFGISYRARRIEHRAR